MIGSYPLVFLRRAAQHSVGRLIFTIPPEVSRFISRDQIYEVSLRPVGTMMVQYS